MLCLVVIKYAWLSVYQILDEQSTFAKKVLRLVYFSYSKNKLNVKLLGMLKSINFQKYQFIFLKVLSHLNLHS